MHEVNPGIAPPTATDKSITAGAPTTPEYSPAPRRVNGGVDQGRLWRSLLAIAAVVLLCLIGGWYAGVAQGIAATMIVMLIDSVFTRPRHEPQS